VHVAQYSTRKGTIADRTLVDDVPQEEKKRRLMAVDALQEQISTGINAQLLNQTMEVLVEGQDKGKWKGRTRTDKLVFFEDERDFHGRMTQVKITKTSPWSLQGVPVTH
jgi:tRNA-2-methylthio-N6-dimethylallyladenosine synthase